MAQPRTVHTTAEVLKNCQAMGWQVRRGSSGHQIITSPIGATVTVNEGLTGTRGLANQTAVLRKAGYYDAWQRYCEEVERQRQRTLAQTRQPQQPAPQELPTRGIGSPWLEQNVPVSPELALSWLTGPTPILADGTPLTNRSVSAGWVKEIVGWIERGEWTVSPQGIVLTTNGGLLDGQHRLHAVIESGRTVNMNVWHDMPPETFAVLDQGRRRTNGHVLETRNETNAVVLASAGKLLYCYLACVEGEPGFTDWRAWHPIRQSANQLLRLLGPAVPGDPYTGHGSLRDAVKPGSAMVSHVKGNRAAGIVAWHLIDSTWSAQSTKDTFAEGIRTGVGLSPGDPALAVRNWLICARAAQKESNKRDRHLLALLYGWRMHVRGQRVADIRSLDSKQVQAMPQE